MDFGPGSLKSFEFVPEYQGNRELPAEEQVSCEILRPTTAQRLAMESETAGSLERWRDAHFQEYLAEGAQDQETRLAILAWGQEVLHILKVVCTYTRNWRNASYDGRALITPAEVCLHVPLPLGSSGQPSLLREVYGAVIRASSLTGEQLKNFASQCAGISSAIIPPPTDGATASTAA